MLLESAAKIVLDFQSGDLGTRISMLEKRLVEQEKRGVVHLCNTEGLNASLLEAGFEVKKLAGQIDTLIHAAGMLIALPAILVRDEMIKSVSLGAGNTGRMFDLETTHRIAEFKFIHWRGGSESIRQNSLFKDFFTLAEADTEKDRYLYVLGAEEPLRFLHSGRSLKSVMSRNKQLEQNFYKRYPENFDRVKEYFNYREDRVQIVDLLPVFAGL